MKCEQQNSQILERRDEDVAEADDLQIGYLRSSESLSATDKPYVLVLDVLQQLQLAVGALSKDWSAEGLHDLLDCDRGTGKLIF